MSDPTPTIERMEACLCRWEPAGDDRAIFLRCYALMTENMIASLAAGEFHDPAWVSHLLDHFADFYFTALEQYETDPQLAPAVWRCAHHAATRKGALVIQQLLLGVNAHINYDLIFATADLLEEEGASLSSQDLERRQADYNHVNAVINRTINEVQAEILNRREPVLEVVDVLLGPVDEWLIEFEITRWRDEVWAQAVHRMRLSDLQAREQHREAVEAAAMLWAKRMGG